MLDIMRPGLEGLEGCRRLRSASNVPIMMLTTESSQALKQQGREAGATGWMVKPFDPDKLLEMLRRAFAQTAA